MPSTRQLAAIMFTDMLGFTALMQQDEQLAIDKRDRVNKIFERELKNNNGKLLQNYGDGTLSIFSSAIECINAAIAIQKGLMQSPKVDLRIGIHTGDIVYDEKGIYGDGVNVASRLESLAVPGGIFISEKVYDDIKNQKHIDTIEIGFFDLKNVHEHIRVYAISNDGLVVPDRDDIKGKTKDPVNALAVLPFINLSGDNENEYFSDGITEELINALTAVEGLQVISRTSAFAWKGKQQDIRAIATKLNVEKILEGSVRKSGNRVRITAQLINAADGFHIWSETYDRDLNDIFQVQDEISKIIANKLKAQFSPKHKTELIVKASIQNLEAYSIFLKAKFYNNKETPQELFKAIEYYKQVIALESSFAMPHALLAGVYAMLGSVGVIPGKEAHNLILEESNRALELDPLLAQGHVARGVAYLFFEWNWNAAYNSLMKAIELSPGASEPYWILGYYYLIKNEPSKSASSFEHAWQKDPLSMSIARSLGIAYFYDKRFDDVIRLSDMQLDVIPGNWYALSIKGFAIGLKGDWNAALKIFIQSKEISAGAALSISYLAYCYGMLNRKTESMLEIKLLEDFQIAHPELAKNEDLALAWCGMGDFDKTFEFLFKAAEKKEEMLCYMIHSPVYASIRPDPRFIEVKKKMNL
jgi:TolB-like protein/class 3 adenylate cyclase